MQVEDGTLTKFESNDYIKEVYVPDCVKRIGCRAFYEAPVGKVVIPDGVTAIEADAFLDCGLREIEIPDSVTTIETWAFSGCEALREITIPESVTSIGSWAIGYREDQFRPWLDPIPFGHPVIIYGNNDSELSLTVYSIQEAYPMLKFCYGYFIFKTSKKIY